MKVRIFLGTGLLLTVGLAALPTLGPAQDQAAVKNAIRLDHVIAGGPKEFMEVRHLVLEGTNTEIGQALATIAMERFKFKPEASPDRFRTRVQRRFIEKNYPILHDRMRGVAAALGKKIDDDAWDFTGLDYLLGLPGGCSVVYFPPGVTADGSAIVSRNYEYPTGTVFDTHPKPGELPANARPYLIEMHPDKGYPSMALCAYDLLNGVIDGINSEGLTVTMMTDVDLVDQVGLDIPEEVSVGLGVQQVLRMLLDTCSDVESAKEALLMTKQYYEFLPQHFLIADRHGKAFVWEYSQSRNREFMIENPGKPLISTNFRLHRHLEAGKPPSAIAVKDVCSRYCALAERIAAQPAKLTVGFIKETHKIADAAAPAAKGEPPPVRTLWHALYYPEQRKVQVSFYLRDEPDAKQPGKVRIVRSDYIEVVLRSLGAKQPRQFDRP
jgi:Acyl-coenzyme A:6-aminopenicillanic acid acyl-transferase